MVMDIGRARKAASMFNRVAVCRNGRDTVVAVCMSEDTGRTRRNVRMSVVVIATISKVRNWIIHFKCAGACSTAIT